MLLHRDNNLKMGKKMRRVWKRSITGGEWLREPKTSNHFETLSEEIEEAEGRLEKGERLTSTKET